MTDMDKIATEWLRARGIIMAFLRELLPAMTQEHLEHNAAAILARLASATPPLLLTAGDEAEKEREACAQVADRFAWIAAQQIDGLDLRMAERAGNVIAAAIRSRT